MIFLYPAFLFGLLTLIIPILIHLFNFRKSRRVYFSNNQFLRNVKESSSSKLKLKHILVLASRLLFITFLVLAFAQPFIPGKKDDVNRQSVAIYLDNSFSMSATVRDGQTALDLGLAYVNDLVTIYPTNTEFIFLTNEFLNFSNRNKSGEQVKEAVTEVTFTPVSRNLDEVINRIHTIKGDNQSSDIYLISDFQKSTSGNINLLPLDSSNSYSVVSLFSDFEGNVFVDSLYLNKPFILSGQNNELEVSLFNTSDELVDELILKLFINDVQVANSSLDIGPNDHNIVKFDIPAGILKGQNKCKITFEEFPVTFDNELFFSLNAGDKISILEIKGDNVEQSVEKVYGNKALFEFASFNVNNLDYNLINNTDLIILNGVEEISPTVAHSITDYLKNEGHLLIVPADIMNIDSYQKTFSGVRFFNSTGDPNLTVLSPPDFSNPFYENVFEEKEARLDMPSAKKTINWTSSANNLLTFRNGDPFLAEMDEIGKVYILAAPLKNAFTNFHKHALFVPVMYKIATLSKVINEKLFFSVSDHVISLKVDSLSKNKVYKLTNENQELIPNQRLAGSHLVIEVPKNELRAGFYELSSDERIQKVLAFNYDKSESLTERYQEEELVDIFSIYDNVNFFGSDNQSKFTKEIKEANLGISLWEYAIILALFFLLCEILMLRFL